MKKFFLLILSLLMVFTVSFSLNAQPDDNWALEFTVVSNTTWIAGTEYDITSFYQYFYPVDFSDFHAYFFAKTTTTMNQTPDFLIKVRFTDGTSAQFNCAGHYQACVRSNTGEITTTKLENIYMNQARFKGLINSSSTSEINFVGMFTIPNQGKVVSTILICPQTTFTTSQVRLSLKWMYDDTKF